MNETKTIYQRLIALQAELPVIGKDKNVDAQKFKYKYATFDSIQETIQPLLTTHGLGYMFTTVETGLNCTLFDVDGNIIDFVYPARLVGSPQEIGSAISYAKRYALSAILGLIIGGEDDDGTVAENNPKASVPTIEHWMTPQEFAKALTETPDMIKKILNAKTDAEGRTFAMKKEYRTQLESLLN